MFGHSFLDSAIEPNCPYQVNGTDQEPPHPAFQHNDLDPVHMELEHLAYQIRQNGATELLLKKMSTALREYEAMVRLEKELVHARFKVNLARIDAMHQGAIPQTEPENSPAQNPAELPTVQQESEPAKLANKTQLLIDEQLDIIDNLPVLEGRQFLIPFSAKVTAAYCELCGLDPSYLNGAEIANKVLMKIIDILEREWIAYVRNKGIRFTAVHLPVIVDFLQEEAEKEAFNGYMALEE